MVATAPSIFSVDFSLSGLMFPAGSVRIKMIHLKGFPYSFSVSYSFNDKTNSGIEMQAEFNGTLRDEQQPAADAMIGHYTGILSATTAFGKTVVASYLLVKRKTNTLILVHTQSLMMQWQKSLEQLSKYYRKRY